MNRAILIIIKTEGKTISSIDKILELNWWIFINCMENGTIHSTDMYEDTTMLCAVGY